MRTKTWIPAIVLFLFLASCNLPIEGRTSPTQPTEVNPVSEVGAVVTSVGPTAVATITEIASPIVPLTATFTPSPIPTVTSIPTQCNASVTATVNANVRSGPDTAYAITGALLLGQSAAVVGRNDANTWWYINHMGISGGYGWIAGSVVTTSCLPPDVQVVAAPPLPPTNVPTAVSSVPTKVPTAVLMRPTRVPTMVLFRPTLVPSVVPANP